MKELGKSLMRENKIKYPCLVERFSDQKPYLEAISKLVDKGDFTLGPSVEECEKKFAEFTGCEYGVGVSNGTEGLRLGLLALGVGPGDEVITTPTSFIATAASIDLVGAKPVFVDIDDEFLIDVNKIEQAITPKTKAIMPVHWGGNVCDMPKIMELAEKYNLKVIEDAAPAVGATINGKHAGSWGDIGEFSFHPYKNFCVWGDGGMVTTNNQELSEKLKLYRNHGLKNRNEVEFFAYNSRLAPIQAVIALIQLTKIDQINEKRIANSKYLDLLLRDIKGVVVPPRRENVVHIFNNYMVLVQDRERLLEYLSSKGIEALVHYPIPMHLQKAADHLGYKKGDFPKAEYQANHVVTLPNHEHLDRKDIEYIAETVKSFYRI